MSEHSVARSAPVPWSFRLFGAVPLPPLCVGTAIAAALIAFYFGVEYATGQIGRVLAGEAEDHVSRHFRTMVVNALMLGYLPTAQIYLARWTRRNLAELRALLRTSAAVPAPREFEPVSPTSRGGRLAGALAALFTPLIFVVLPAENPSELLRAETWIFEHLWDNAMTVPLGWLAGRFFYALVADSRNVSRLAARLDSIDLLDLSPLQPLVRQGLRSALLAIAFVSIGAGHIGNIIISLTAMSVALGLMLCAAVAALALPLRGLHRRIREEKRARLAQLRSVIGARERELLESGSHAVRASAELPGLLALETRIAAVREWPLDASTLLRVGLYLTLGIGSWLGAAAVERLLDRVLA